MEAVDSYSEVLDPEIDRATARTNFVSHHVPKTAALYTYGGTFDFVLVRDPEGWRIGDHTIRILWEAGESSPGPVDTDIRGVIRHTH